MEYNDKIVNFMFCKFCEHKNLSEIKEPCYECLDNPINTNSVRPLHFKDNGSLEKLLKKLKDNSK